MIELIPAIDIIDGKCVRLSKGDYATKIIYSDNPLDVAKQFEAYGIKRLHIVDLNGAESRHIVNYRILERIASHTSLVIDFGGGVKSDEDLVIAFENGANLVTVGSVAVKDPDLFTRWIDRYGSERIILGADVKGGKIAVGGWKEDSGQELLPFLDGYVKKGISHVLCTDISRDGMLEGPAIKLYTSIMEAHPSLRLIASGGVSCLADIEKLSQAGIPAVVFGKAFYEGRITLKELSHFIDQSHAS